MVTTGAMSKVKIVFNVSHFIVFSIYETKLDLFFDIYNLQYTLYIFVELFCKSRDPL